MGAIVVSDELLAEAKNFLDITWDDEEADKKLKGQIRRGISYIMSKTGVSTSAFDGNSVDDRAQTLLFNYLLYDRAGALDRFARNYQDWIVGLRIKWEVANAAGTNN